jgi:Acetyltransferase (GNAT) domain
MTGDLLEICVKGKYFNVPTLEVNGKNIVVGGRLIKVATIHAEEWLAAEIDDPEECIKKLKDTHSHDLKADVFTFTQKLPNIEPKYPYPMEWDSLAVIRLTYFEDWWERILPYETRKYARRAIKRGVVVKVQDLDDQLIKNITELNNASPLRQGRPFDHYGKTFEQVKKDQASFPGRSDFICAYFGEELIGFIKIVRCDKTAAMLQIITKPSSIDKRPGNALIVKTVEHCLEIGMKYLTYGKYVYGNKRTSTLIDFKRRHGFEEVLVPRYYVPLTVKGKIGIAINLHRDIVGIMPNSVIQLGVYMREKWYRVKLLAGRCGSTLERSNCTRLMERSIPPARSSKDGR